MKTSIKISLLVLFFVIGFSFFVCLNFEPEKNKSQDAMTRIALLYALLTSSKASLASIPFEYNGSPVRGFTSYN